MNGTISLLNNIFDCSAVVAAFSLESTMADGTGGAFEIRADSTNGRASVEIPRAPVDSRQTIDVRTTNAAAYLKLHPTFEGSFMARTRGGKAAINPNEGVKDPAGRGRHRSFTWEKGEGKAFWSGEHMGLASVASTGESVTLEF